MTRQEANTFIYELNQTAMNEIVKRQYFVLIFADTAGELHGYDTRVPANCLNSVLEKNKDFVFVHAVAESNEQSVRALCTTLRQSRDIRTRLKAMKLF